MIRSTRASGREEGSSADPGVGSERAKPRHRGSGDRVPCGGAGTVGRALGPMQLPGTKGRLSGPIRSPGSGVRVLGFRLLTWLGVSGGSGSIRLPGSVGRAVPARQGAPDLPVGSGDAGMSSGGGMSPMRWGGGQPAVGAAGELPAALMHGSVMGSAQQGQVGQVGGAAMEPVAHVVGFAPGQGPLAVGEDTAAVADGQGGALGGLDDPGGPSDLQGLGGGAAQGRGQQGRGGLEPGC